MSDLPEISEKSEKPEDKILDAAMAVVTEQTISGTRMRLIAEQAGMVSSNVHYYYKTKDDLMLALQKRVHAHFRQYRKDALAGADDTLEGKLGALFEQKIDIMLKHAEYDYVQTDFWLQSRVNKSVKKNRQASYNAWRQDVFDVISHYRPDLKEKAVALLVVVIVSMMEGAAMQYLVDRESFDLLAYFRLCSRMVRDELDKESLA
ncbi:MAG: TetR/AcrR family transcriptional regulator [Planctomycetaceae bacterium]|nr:TetR/AcrR family transcriptional regulator [Planctomycetaceae bacterium]